MRAIIIVAALWWGAAACAQDDDLSAAEVQAALAGAGSNHWIKLTDMRMVIASAFMDPSTTLAQEPSIILVMPEALIASQSVRPRKQFLSYTPAREEQRRSLTVIAEGIALGSRSGPLCSSIARIVLLSDRSGDSVLEASSSGPLEQTWQNAFGASAVCQALRASFPITAVRRISSAAPNGEFLVAVFYENSADPRIFKIKRRMMKKLGIEN